MERLEAGAVHERQPSARLHLGATLTPPRTTLGTKIFWALVIVGFAAAGFGGIKTYLDQSAIGDRLEDDGTEVEANVVSATEIRRRRTPTYHELVVSYDPPGPRILEFADVQDCSEERYDGAPRVGIIYLPDDPDVVRLLGCASSFDSDVLPGIVGVVFVGLDVFLLWWTRRIWTG